VESTKLSLSELFTSYEQDLVGHLKSIDNRCENYNRLPQDEKANTISLLAHELKEAEKCLKQIDIEVASLPSGVRLNLNTKVENYKLKVQVAKCLIDKVQEKYNEAEATENLFRDRSDPRSEAQRGSRERLINTGETIVSSGNRLDETNRLAKHTEFVTIAAQQALMDQRGTLLKSQGRSDQYSKDIAYSNTLLNSMERRKLWEKGMLVVIIILLGIIDGFVFYLKIR